MLDRFRQHRIQANAVAWILAALVFRALVPAGFMLGGSDAQGLTVQFCHGGGLATTYVEYDQDGRSADHGSAERNHSQCPFAASALMAPPPVPAGPVLGLQLAVSATPDSPVVALPAQRDLRPGARAPPSIA